MRSRDGAYGCHSLAIIGVTVTGRAAGRVLGFEEGYVRGAITKRNPLQTGLPIAGPRCGDAPGPSHVWRKGAALWPSTAIPPRMRRPGRARSFVPSGFLPLWLSPRGRPVRTPRCRDPARPYSYRRLSRRQSLASLTRFSRKSWQASGVARVRQGRKSWELDTGIGSD
jgi:hypothetical protein